MADRIGVSMAKLSVVERFHAKVEKTDTCWLWTAFVDQDGYGKFWDGEQITFAHRVAYRLFVGPIPDGYQVDHVKERGCSHRNCVRPDHLEAVPPVVNNARSTSVSAKHGRKTHCVNGHEFTPENTYERPTGGRHCRECRREVELRRKARRAARRSA